MLTTSSDRHVPVRTCVGCRRRAPQTDLVRCVLGADGLAHVDRTAPGRGAWLCGLPCLHTAIARRAFERAWRRPVAPEALVALTHDLDGDVTATASPLDGPGGRGSTT